MRNAFKILFFTGKDSELNKLSSDLSGLDYVTKSIEDESNFENNISSFNPDIVFLTVLNGSFDGIDLCYNIKKLSKSILVVFLTRRNESFTTIACFDAGADDFISLPISILLLKKKIDSLLRFKRISTSFSNILNDDLIIDRGNYLVVKNKNKIDIPKKEFEILLLLSSNTDRIYSVDEIYSKIWGDNSEINNKSIPVYIKKLRNKIGDEHIKTIKGSGYRFTFELN